MNFKLILHGLMLTTSALAFFSSPLALSDDTTTDEKEKYTLEDKALLDIPEYVKATDKSKEGFDQWRKKLITSSRADPQAMLSDIQNNPMHPLYDKYYSSFLYNERGGLYDERGGIASLKRHTYKPTPKEFSGAHWAADKKFCAEKLGLEEGKILTGNKIELDILTKGPKLYKPGKDHASQHPEGLRSLANQIAPKASVNLGENEMLLKSPDIFQQGGYAKSGIIQYVGFYPRFDALTNEEGENFGKNTEGKLLITAWGDEREWENPTPQGLLHLLNNKTVRDATIFVVNVDNDYTPHDSSNLPSEKERDYKLTSLGKKQGQSDKRIAETLKGLQDNTLSTLGTDVWCFVGDEKEIKAQGYARSIGGKVFNKETSGNYAAALVSGAAALVMELGNEKGVNLSPAEVQWILLNSARKSGVIAKAFFNYDKMSADPDKNKYIPEIILPEDEYEAHATKDKAAQEEKGKTVDQFIYKKFDPTVYGRGFLDVRRALLLTKLFCDAKKKSSFTLKQVPKEILEEFNAMEKKETRAAAEKIMGALKIAAAKKLKEKKKQAQQKEDEEEFKARINRPRSQQMHKREADNDASNIRKTLSEEKNNSR